MTEKIPKKKKAHKGTLGDRCLKTLAENNDKVILALREGGEIIGQIRGVGQYTILVNEEGEDLLVFKHSIKFVKKAK